VCACVRVRVCVCVFVCVDVWMGVREATVAVRGLEMSSLAYQS